MNALVLGGAENVWCDVEAMEPLIGGRWREHDRAAVYRRLTGEELPLCERHGRTAHRVPVEIPGWLIFAANDIGSWWPEHIDHWASLHPERFTRPDGWRNPDGGEHGWEGLRRANGFSGGYLTWAKREPNLVDMIVEGFLGGSTGRLAVHVYDQLADRADWRRRAVLCGVPMDDGPHFPESTIHKTGAHWSRDSSDSHWRAWQRRHESVTGWCKSMSGRTKGFLGAPSAQWLTDEMEAA